MHAPHARPAAEVLSTLESSSEGLAADEARRRLEQYGPNRLEPPPPRSALVRLLAQFHNILIYILLVAAVLSAFLGHWVDSFVILGVVIINAGIGFMQEGKAEEALQSLKEMLSPEGVVRRNGQRRKINAAQIVPGDVVLLEGGDRVPADLRLFRARNLRIDEAMLTGESEPAEKSIEPVQADALLGDRIDMAYSGTLVTGGVGAGVVVATAEQTEIGRISGLLGSVQTLTTPLIRQVDEFGRLLAVVILLLAAGTFVFGVTVREFAWAEMFMAAVGLAVAAIPEGLPAILTITLSIGVRRMAGRNAIIRKLPAVDTLGSVTVICSDKTGTLTRNEMTVQHAVTTSEEYFVSGVGYAPAGEVTAGGQPVEVHQRADLAELARAGLLCNEATLRQEDDEWMLHGDPTEGALIPFAAKAGLDFDGEHLAWPRLDHIPFDSDRRFMATLHRSPRGGNVIFVKGAPERILEMTGDADARQWLAANEKIASEGLRVLAIGRKQHDRDTLNDPDVETGVALLGLVGMIDPPRDEAIRAIRQCRTAGIQVKMITGDQPVTAMAIGRQMGMSDGEHALTGRDVEKLDDEQLRLTVQKTDVFARVSPEHKLRIVQALQANGQVTAMTGDGVNDAPALKRADVGVAMGIKGTDVSKEAADMVLTDDNFASIAYAVEEGRTVYDNLRKTILFLLPTNGGQAMVVVAAVALGFTLPLTPVQILWVNMVAAVMLGLTLAFEPPEPDVMHRPPRRPDTRLMTGFFAWRVAFVSAILCAGTFGMFFWAADTHGPGGYAQTVAINTLVLFQVWYLFNTRFITRAVVTPADWFGNRQILLGVAGILILQALLTYAPVMQRLFGTEAIGLWWWLIMIPMTYVVYVLVELEKWVIRRRGGV